MGDKLVIIIEVFGYILPDVQRWEHSGISLVEILGGNHFPLCDDEIRVLCESLEEIAPLKNERWHKLTLQREHEEQGYQQPPNIYYRLLNTEIVPLTCLTCGQSLGKENSEEVDRYSIDPYCSQFCAEVGNGVPLPYSQGALTFDRIFNQNNDGLFNI